MRIMGVGATSLMITSLRDGSLDMEKDIPEMSNGQDKAVVLRRGRERIFN